MSFRLDITGRYVIEDDGAPHPTVRTIPEAYEHFARLELQGAKYERDHDLAVRAGRTINADVFAVMATTQLKAALELYRVLQSVESEVAA